jgi:hypothetical protein
MATVSTDLRQGVNVGAAVKVPCRAATTAAITLSGEQTVDGVALVTGDRCLVKDQASGVNNGIYDVDTGAWTRSLDFDGTFDAKTGTFVYVTAGSTNTGFWYITTTGTITIETTSIAFARASSVLATFTAFVQTLFDDADADSFLQTLIASLTAETVLATDDVLPFGDTSESKGNKMTVSSFIARLGNLLVRMEDDFLGEEIDGNRWQSLLGTDAEVRAAIVLADQVSGVVRMTTGDDAAATMAVNGVQLQSNLNWKANQGGLLWEGKVSLSAITSVALFFGFTDQRAVLEMPFTISGVTLTSNASNACGVLFDTEATTDNFKLVGVANDVDATVQDAGVAPTAATFETWRIEISAAGVATFYRNGTVIGTTMTGAVTITTALTPVVAAFSRTSASRSVDIDRIFVQASR